MMSAHPHNTNSDGKGFCACASLEAKKLFSPGLKIAVVFLIGFCPRNERSWEEGHDGYEPTF
jgi:hypothetical protein